jgi:hypothetical protein
MAEKEESMAKMVLPGLLIGTVVVVAVAMTGRIMTEKSGVFLKKYPGVSQVMASRQGSGRNPSSFPIAF